MARSRGSADVETFIRRRLEVRPAPGVPGIRLYQAHPASGLARLLGRDGPPPYWAYGWAGGTVLARYILSTQVAVRGLRVLDLGTGSGIVAIAAAMAGAARVEAVDIDPVAVVAAGLNAAENGVEIALRAADGLAGTVPGVDLITAGDLFYDPEPAQRAAAFLGRCREAGIRVLVGDPGRRHLPLARLERLAGEVVPDFEGGAGVPAGVFAFDPGG